MNGKIRNFPKVVRAATQQMHRKCHSSFTLLFSLICLAAGAQISPGALTTAHANLEGLSRCTQCHILGDKVSNAKCLDCHTELKSRIEAGKGFHISAEVRGQDCFKCHSEHHGRNFEMIRFDIERFDHSLTGYTLTGAHVNLDCAECHKRDFIRDNQLRLKTETYLGLGTQCTACHTDFHQGTLSNTCTDCHTTESFVSASQFSHAKTDFPLRGAHQNVDCASCHQVTTRNGSSFQEFSGVTFTNCSSCHNDPHSGRFGGNCRECHVEESFHVLRGMGDFNHNRTRFPLAGKHRTINCTSCHDTRAHTSPMFKDFAGKDVTNCTACHDDVHDQIFGNDCRACHSEESFRAVRNFTALDHQKTNFPLEGKHEVVDCRKCHEAPAMIESLPHNRCADCHTDFHEGQFVTNSRTPDCASCHTVDGFAGSTFTVAQHNETAFPLTGAHLATPCFSCHFTEDKWLFKNIGTRCIDCHTDIHAGSIGIQYYQDQTCTSCHVTESWRSVVFDHTLTGFTLEGAHTRQACSACHLPDHTADGTNQIVFSGLSADCVSCHQDIHRQQFEVNGVTDCSRCHGYAHWSPGAFDHNTARFVLEGAHVTVACDACHRETVENGVSFVTYRLENFACVDCHK